MEFNCGVVSPPASRAWLAAFVETGGKIPMESTEKSTFVLEHSS